jgi:myo-inositol-1(or 4)-monophosphatase
MNEIEELLSLTKSIAYEAAKKIQAGLLSNLKKHNYRGDIRREMKAEADILLDDYIISQLKYSGANILSEESGFIKGKSKPSLTFIVDPLDGTVNFVRDCGPCAVSIALWENNTPVFGVLCLIHSLELAWGGKEFGSFFAGRAINVSSIRDKDESILCTGIPSRMNIISEINQRKQIELMSSYGKIRMFGAASISLLHVAKGSAEVYSEFGIMLWDVAAGLALIEGAGGSYQTQEINIDSPINIYASNKKN